MSHPSALSTHAARLVFELDTPRTQRYSLKSAPRLPPCYEIRSLLNITAIATHPQPAREPRQAQSTRRVRRRCRYQVAWTAEGPVAKFFRARFVSQLRSAEPVSVQPWIENR